jgi:radical SAM protein with 4Fe4S-binding SPASM domain
MDDAVFENCVRQTAAWEKRPKLVLNMHGEPLLDKNLVSKLGILKKYGMAENTSIQTNAAFLSGDIARALIDIGIGQVAIGFDGATSPVYEVHRKGCNFNTVLDNIKHFAGERDRSSSKTRIVIQYVHTPQNDHEVLPSYEMFNGFLNRELDCLRDVASHSWASESLNHPVVFKTPEKDIIPCEQVRVLIAILADGRVAACCWDYNLKCKPGPLGNVNEQDLVSIWNGEPFEKLREALNGESTENMSENCRNCNMISNREFKLKPALDDPDRVREIDGGYIYSFTRS